MTDDVTLISKLEEVTAKKEDMMIVILLDGSGSITSQFPEIKAVAQTLAEKNEGSMISIIQFSSRAEVVCPFTTNIATLKKSISGMKQLGGDTNMKDAFFVTRTTLIRSVTEDSVPIVFFVTDGEPTGQDPAPEIQKLLSMKPSPTVIGVGIGADISHQSLEKLLPNQPIFMSNNGAMLDQTLKKLKAASPSEHEQPIRIKFEPNPEQGLQPSKSDLVLDVYISAEEKIKTLPKGTKIKFLGSAYYYPSTIEIGRDLPAMEEEKFTVKLVVRPEVKAGGEILEFPEKIHYTVHIPKENKSLRGYVQMQICWLSKDFFTDFDVNFLVWGPMGNGKSSFINGIIHLFKRTTDIQMILKIAKENTHVTKEYNTISIGEQLDESIPIEKELASKLRLNFKDPWGVTKETYKNVTIRDFIEGRVPQKTRMTDSSFNEDPNEKERIDAVFLIVSLGSANNPEIMSKLEDQVRQVRDKDMRPIVVATYVKKVASQKEIEESVEVILSSTHLGKNDIFLHDNYTEDEKLRNMHTDLSYRRILEKGLAEAKLRRRLNSKNRKSIEVAPTVTHSTVIGTPTKTSIPTAKVVTPSTTTPTKAASADKVSIVFNLGEGDKTKTFRVGPKTTFGSLIAECMRVWTLSGEAGDYELVDPDDMEAPYVAVDTLSDVPYPPILRLKLA